MDVVIIGNSSDAIALAQFCTQNGLATIIVNTHNSAPDGWTGDWMRGKAVIPAPGLVTILDPETGDERKLVPAKAIVLTPELSELSEWPSRMLGITKLGAKLGMDTARLVVNSDGTTGAEGIFGTGPGASAPTPDLQSALLNYIRATS